MEKEFTQIYHLDLHGNIRKNPKLSGTTHNVFGIQVGVGITLAVRNKQNPQQALYYFRVPEFRRKTEKLAYIMDKKNITNIEWTKLTPDNKHTWLTEGIYPEFNTFFPLGLKYAKGSNAIIEAIMSTYAVGVNSSRDSVVYDFCLNTLQKRIHQAIEDFNIEVFRWVRASRPKDIDNFVQYDKVKWSEHLKIRIEERTKWSSKQFAFSYIIIPSI